MGPGLDAYLRVMVDEEASDLFLSVGAPACMKVAGRIRRLSEQLLTAEHVAAMAHAAMNERERAEFEAEWEMNLGLSRPGIGRFRLNIYRQRGEVAMVVRYITADIPRLDDLGLPPVLRELVMLPRGLVLVVGATGAGKSTTLAAMIDHRNRSRTDHILTIEEPIEYVHQHRLSVVDQREVGLDTKSYANALKNAMREAPDVIMIGEIRDRETMQAAMAYAETGHLCLSTLHANNANQTLDRIVNFFPESARAQLLSDLAQNLRAVVSQRLLPAVQGGRVPAVEVLTSTPYVRGLIEKGEVTGLKEAMRQGAAAGMQTFDDAMFKLHAEGKVSYADIMEHADSRTDLALRVRLQGGTEGLDRGLQLDALPEPPTPPPGRKA
ncbi:PilT/PilU family type 4a pilus ATPase [Arenimonas sp. MALMAid1274]|uniref:PilT/PilU family type 4a pilus ATPase n=1 Tax=Arenimonas sp. MALMAid1274 TaxID=3411630 RepID=UPI003BA176F1